MYSYVHAGLSIQHAAIEDCTRRVGKFSVEVVLGSGGGVLLSCWASGLEVGGFEAPIFQRLSVLRRNGFRVGCALWVAAAPPWVRDLPIRVDG